MSGADKQTSQEGMKEMDGTGKRQRENTEKMEELYHTKVSKYKDKLYGIEDLLSVHILNSASIPNETVRLREMHSLIQKEFENYEDKHNEFCEYLQRECTKASNSELETQQNNIKTMNIKVQRVLEKLKDNRFSECKITLRIIWWIQKDLKFS